MTECLRNRYSGVINMEQENYTELTEKLQYICMQW